MSGIVDAHVHVGRWRDPAFACRNVDFRETIAELSSCGVTAAFVFPTDEKDNEGLLAEVKLLKDEQDPFAVFFFPWVDPENKKFPAFLEEERNRISGLKFHPSYDRRPVTDPVYTPFFRFAAQHGLPVIIHCGRWQEVSGYGFALEMARRMEDVTFVLSHLGGDMPQLQAGAIGQVAECGLQNVRFGTESIREYWNLTLGIRKLGAHRFLFGSDFSLGHPSVYRAVLGLCDISETETSLILGKNAMELVSKARN